LSVTLESSYFNVKFTRLRKVWELVEGAFCTEVSPTT
jgi:hypothetical protein